MLPFLRESRPSNASLPAGNCPWIVSHVVQQASVQLHRGSERSRADPTPQLDPIEAAALTAAHRDSCLETDQGQVPRSPPHENRLEQRHVRLRQYRQPNALYREDALRRNNASQGNDQLTHESPVSQKAQRTHAAKR